VEAGEALQVGYSNGIVGVAGLYGNMVWGGFKIALKLGDLRDVFLARFNSSTGTVIGLDTLKSRAGGEEWITAMTADKNGSFSVGGFFTDLLYVSGKTLTPVYDQDWFLAKFGPKGCTCATPTSDYTYSINGLGKVDFVYNGTILIDSVVWDFGDGSKASGRRINKTYNTAGTYTVCASVYNSCGMSTHCENINITGVSVQQAKHLSSISVYPNPTSGELKVRGAKGTTMDIYNMVGKHVLHMSLISSDATLDVTHLSAGTYMIRFTDNQQRTILRFDKL
jgi:PKD repeat protein